MPAHRHFLPLVVLALLALLIAAWLGYRQTSPLSTSGGAQPVDTVQVRKLRLGLNIGADSALYAAARRFAEQVGERSQGRLSISVHPDQQLGSDDQMLEMARNGELDLLLTPTAKLSSAIPAMQYADLPFYFSGREELYAMLDGEPGHMLLAKLGSIDLVGLTFWENGFKQFTANKPIRTPGDFGKLRIRTMKSRLIIDQFESLGAQAIPIDFHATRQALLDGAVDGQENPLVAIVGMRFHEVQKHMTLSNHAYLAYVFMASKRVFETLPPALREIIADTARELTLWERAETLRRETAQLETVRASGINVHTLSSEERQAFTKALTPVSEKFSFEVGYDLLAKTEELRLAKKSPGQLPLLIGLDADLSMSSAQGGGAILRGMQMAIEEINLRGGLLGQPVHVLARDHAGNPQAGLRNLEFFAAQPTLLAVFGGIHSSVIMAELDDIHRRQIPYLIPWAAGQGLIHHDYQPGQTFRLSLNDRMVAPFLLEHALKPGKPVTVLLENSAWGRSNELSLKPMLEKLPAGTVEVSWFNVGEPALAARVESIVRNGAGALMLVANPGESLHIVQAMAKQEKPIPIFAHWGLTSGPFWETTKTALQRVDLRFVQTTTQESLKNNARLQAFFQRYRERYGLAPEAPLPSQTGTLHAYELTHLLAKAVILAKSTDRAAIRQALEKLPDHAGILRDYRPPFTAQRHDALGRQDMHLARFDPRGRIVLAE